MIGQDRLREKIQVLVHAAQQREDALDHVLLYGPPGLGKTTLCHILANEMGANLKVTAGPAVEKAGDLAAILTNMRKGDILFIDEIHRLGRAIEEILYPAMEDYSLNIIVGSGPGRAQHPTEAAEVHRGGRDDAIWRCSRRRYAPDLAWWSGLISMNRRPSNRSCCGRPDLLDVEIAEAGAAEIARRSRGTPRVALRLLRRVRDYAQVRADGRIDHEVAVAGLALSGCGRTWAGRVGPSCTGRHYQ